MLTLYLYTKSNSTPIKLKRILILGCSGAGKSTLARKLNTMLGLPITHLDKYYWKPNWVESSKDEFEDKVNHLIKNDEWIMDGNYGCTLDIRIPRADLIIFKDASTLTCIYRITKRIIKYWGQVRPGITEGCIERFDFQFYHYVATYNLVRRKPLLRKLKALGADKKVVIIKENNEIEKIIK